MNPFEIRSSLLGLCCTSTLPSLIEAHSRNRGVEVNYRVKVSMLSRNSESG
jgi:hypothetical protein